MNEVRGAEKNSNDLRFMGIIISSAPSLIFRAGCWFLKFKRQANKGALVFKKELIRQGFDKNNADLLTDIYLKPSSLKQYMTFFQ